MKIAAALGVWPFWGWKIINHGGWFTQVKGRSWQKKAFLTVSFMPAWTGYSSWLQNYIKSTSKLHHFYVRSRVYNRITSKVHQNYITFTSLLHHFYVRSDLWTIRTSAPLPGPPARAENGFSGCAGNASRPRNKLRIRSPLSGWFVVAFRAFIGF